jgi:hypothetical protein
MPSEGPEIEKPLDGRSQTSWEAYLKIPGGTYTVPPLVLAAVIAAWIAVVLSVAPSSRRRR